MSQFLPILLTYVVIDAVYLSLVMGTVYKPGYGKLLARNTEWWKLGLGFLAWFALTAGQVYFVKPALGRSSDKWNTFKKGALFGLIVYTVYNGTNIAILKDLKWRMCAVDTLWGTFLSGYIAYLYFAK